MLDGRLGEAVTVTQQFYPDLLTNNLELLFVLRCRQFIEIVNGTEGESVPGDISLPCVRRLQSAHQHGHAVECPANVACHRSCETSQRSSQALPTSDSDRLSNGSALNLSSSSTDKSTVSQNGEAHSATSRDELADHDSDMDTSDNDETALANGSSLQCCMNGSSDLPKCGNATSVFSVFNSDGRCDASVDDDDDDDDDVNLETVMGKIIALLAIDHCGVRHSVLLPLATF